MHKLSAVSSQPSATPPPAPASEGCKALSAFNNSGSTFDTGRRKVVETGLRPVSMVLDFTVFADC
ncbi:MAG: hypothetical protein ABH870_06350 [bacterium]